MRVLLTLLDRLRLVTVQTCEAVIKWREAVEHQARLREDAETRNKRQKWVVSITVQVSKPQPTGPFFISLIALTKHQHTNNNIKQKNK